MCRLSIFVVGAAVAATLSAAPTSAARTSPATTASADAPPKPATTCSGASLQSPGIIPPGTYGPLTVNGVCVMPGGSVHVDGNVVVTPGSVLLANFPPPAPGSPEGDATVAVDGNVLVGK